MRSTAEVFKALSDETRLRILNLLTQGELCVCDIMEILKIGQSKTSRHLAYLRNAGFVIGRRDGVWMHYSLAGANGGIHSRIVEWLREAGNELQHGAADLMALNALRKRGDLCVRCCEDDRDRLSSMAATAKS